MHIAPIKLSSFQPKDWNRAAFERGASIRSDHAYLTRLGLRQLGRARVRTYGVFVPDGRLVGHFTILERRGTRWFIDGLKLDRDQGHRWDEVMTAVLSYLGPAHYRYGWYLSLEEPRSDLLAKLPSVKVNWIEDARVQGVDFSNWENWNSYYRAISENTRRNAAKIDKKFKKVEVRKVRGFSTLPIIPALVRFRASNYARKQLAGHWFSMLVRYFLNAVFVREAFCLDYFCADGRIAAVQLNQEFCALTYYLEGAYNPDISGAAWRLQIDVVKDAFSRNPKGKYIMGYLAFPYNEDEVQGLIRSRQAMRVRDWENQVVYFEYRPAAG